MSNVSRCVTPASCFPIPILAILELSVWHDYCRILLFSDFAHSSDALLRKERIIGDVFD